MKVLISAIRVNQLNYSFRVGIFCNDICGKDVPEKVFSILRLQFELKQISNSNSGGRASLILDQKANSAVKSVLGWKVLNGDWLARPDAKRSQCGAQSFLEVVLPSSQGARSHSHVLRPRDCAGEVVGQVH